jgi:DNA-binding transcriptional MocR family regulator
VEAIARRVALTDLGVSVPSQLLAGQVLDRLPPLVRARRRQLAARCAHLRRRLAHDLPEWTVTAPDGGLCLWAGLPLADGARFVSSARDHSIEVMDGSFAVPGRTPSDHIRICFDRPAPILDEAVDRLVAAWQAMPTVRPPGSQRAGPSGEPRHRRSSW